MLEYKALWYDRIEKTSGYVLSLISDL